MKIYIIKHKGANTFGNFCAFCSRCRVENEFFYRGHYFFQRNHAKKYLKQGSSNPENHEILSLEISKPKYAKCIYTSFPQILEVGKKYKILAEHKDIICIIDKEGNLSTFNKCFFEIK